MALRERVLKGAGGLTTTSQEEVEKLAAEKGRVSAPIQPLETSSIGGNEDQAKMAGTPNQRLSALRTAVQQSVDYSTAKRREQTSGTGDQQAQRLAQEAELQKLEGLGQLSSRVKQIALNRFSQQYSEPDQLELESEQLESLDPAILGRIQSGQATQSDMLVAAEQLGITEVGDVGQLGARLMEALGTDSGTMTEWLSGLAEGQLTLSEFQPEDLTALGYDSMAELADSLGMTEEEASQLSLEGLSDVIDQKQAEMFDSARQLRQVLTDPTATPAAREAARKQLGQLQAVGIDDVEIQFDNLEQSIERGQTVKFDGQEIPVSELLSSEGLELLISQAMSSDESMEALKESEPELHAFIENNRAAFEQLTQEVDADAQAFIDLQQQNMELASTPEGVPDISDDVMSQWYDDWGQLRAEQYEPNGFLQLMQDPAVSGQVKETLAIAADTFNRQGLTEVIDQLGSLSSEEILGLGLKNADAVTKYANNLKARERLSELDPKTQDDVILRDYFGVTDTKHLEGMLKEAMALKAAGVRNINNRSLRMLDRNGDGRLDSISDIKARLLAEKVSLKDLAKRGKRVDQIGDAINSRSTNSLQREAKPAGGYYKHLRDALLNDGTISWKESQQIANNVSKDELWQLYQLDVPGLRKNASAKYDMRKKLNEYAGTRRQEHFNYWTSPERNHSFSYQMKAAGIKDYKSLMDTARDVYRQVQVARRTNPNAKLGNRNYVDMFRFFADQGGLSSDNPVDRKYMDATRRELRKIADYI